MAQPYVGEIRMFAGNFAPNGWMFCEGQTLPISENEVLFQLIGTTYGGDGQETFNLPNLASRVPIHMGTGPDGTTYQIGEMAGTEQETLTVQQIPNHTHPLTASTDLGSQSSPGNTVVLAHSNGLATRYYHLSKFARGLRVGQLVRQKDVIGFVGTTGLSTGPHLHFSVTRNGAFVDPSKLQVNRDPSVPDRAAFLAAIRPRIAALKAIVPSTVARN